MTLYLTLENKELKKLEDVCVGDVVLCDDGTFKPIKNILVISSYPDFIRFSDGCSYYISHRMKIKTLTGFKNPQLWDIVELSGGYTPQIVGIKKIENVMFFRDILIDGNPITPDGLVFQYS